MKTYCAFLRGVNIGGKTMKMAEACDALKAAGLTGVMSVLATGNLIFQSDRPRGKLQNFLKQTLSERFGDAVNLFVKGVDEVVLMLSSVPFEENAELHIYAFICESGFEDNLLDEFDKITPSEGEAARVNNGIFYWQCRKGATLDSGFSKILGRKSMKDKFTSRNIQTVAKVAAKMV
ncbi:MAG: DUF1697 domain-containing protein [Coriobacteriales bacterium]|jgi:uncharacterized protein (DUF1697 family)|nr:DUF1697 domain-containing protein [Coriobacteriales bacterium]